MISIALLICGRITGTPLIENGDYYDIYLRYMQECSSPDATFIFHPYDVREKMEYPHEDDDYDCMMLTGSGAPILYISLSTSDIPTASSAYDDLEWINKLVIYIRRIAETKPHIKLIGVHQFLFSIDSPQNNNNRFMFRSPNYRTSSWWRMCFEQWKMGGRANSHATLRTWSTTFQS